MGKFDDLPDLPANWLDLLYAETIVIQKSMPQNPEEAHARAQQDTMAELNELQQKCPRIYQLMQVSNEALHTTLIESGMKEDTVNRLTGRFTLSTLALLRMLAISSRAKNG